MEKHYELGSCKQTLNKGKIWPRKSQMVVNRSSFWLILRVIYLYAGKLIYYVYIKQY